jgi:hypothetical protein
MNSYRKFNALWGRGFDFLGNKLYCLYLNYIISRGQPKLPSFAFMSSLVMKPFQE